MSILNHLVDKEQLATMTEDMHREDYLPPETLPDISEVQHRMEHRMELKFKMVPHERKGLAGVVSTSEFHEKPQAPSAFWQSVNRGYSASMPTEQLLPEYRGYTPQSEFPGVLCLESDEREHITNSFMFARTSIYPLLSILNFKAISPLISILWADQSACGLNEYYNFIISLQEPAKDRTGDHRARPGRVKTQQFFDKAGPAVLDACIMNVMGHPLTPELRATLQGILDAMDAQQVGGAKYDFIASLL